MNNHFQKMEDDIYYMKDQIVAVLKDRPMTKIQTMILIEADNHKRIFTNAWNSIRDYGYQGKTMKKVITNNSRKQEWKIV